MFSHCLGQCVYMSVFVFLFCASKLENCHIHILVFFCACVCVGVKKLSAMCKTQYMTDWILVRFTCFGHACASPAEAVSFSISLASFCLVTEAIRKIRPV